MKREKCFISVAEPWNFESPDGQNIVRGNILTVKSNQCVVFKADHYLEFDSINSDILILTPRHRETDFSDLSKQLITVNGSLLLKNYEDSLSEKELKENARFIIIGSIRKE